MKACNPGIMYCIYTPWIVLICGEQPLGWVHVSQSTYNTGGAYIYQYHLCKSSNQEAYVCVIKYVNYGKKQSLFRSHIYVLWLKT